MYSRYLRRSGHLSRTKCTSAINPHIYANHHSYSLYSNHNHSHPLSTKNTYHYHHCHINQPHHSIRSFVTKQDTKTHDDSYLKIDEDEAEEEEAPTAKSRKWKSQSKRQKLDSDLESTSEPTVKPSKWQSIKSTINKPFTIIKSKVSRKKKKETDDDSKSIKKETMVHRPGKKSLPSPEQGVMTFIPRHKAQILHILQEECNIFPDEVFPLFPDHKTEEILTEAEDWFGEGVQFVDDARTTQQLLAGQTDLTDSESDDDEEDEHKYIEEDQDEEQLLLEETTDKEEDDDALMVSGKTPLAKIDMAQMTVEEMMSDKPKTTASQLRQQKVSGMVIHEDRTKFREMSFMNPYKYRRIMTPMQIKELYEDQIDKDTMDDEEEAAPIGTHPIWQQDPDNVYEIIQLLREIGFKSNQNATLWPYTEFLKAEEGEIEGENEGEDVGKKEGIDKDTKALVVQDGGGLNPLPDTFNDFYLLLARFPEILGMEIGDIRRKMHVLESFQIDDLRILLLKDPRVLRRPSHHIRWLLEVFDDYFIDDFTQIIELSPHFLASTSKKEMLRRLCFVHKEILEPYKEYNEKIDTKSWYRNMQMELKHLNKNSEFIIKHGKTIQKDKNLENELINGLYLDDKDKENLSDFIIKHPDFIGNANVNRMYEILCLLKKLGIKHKKLNDLLYEYPQILTLSAQALHECVDQIKMNGIRNYRQYIIDNIHDVLTFSAPVDQIVITDDVESQQMQSL